MLHAAPERVAEAASGQQGGTAQGTAALAQVPPGWRDCPSILPPFGQKLTTLRQLEEGLWVLRQVWKGPKSKWADHLHVQP